MIDGLYLLEAFLIACAACVYVLILTQPGEIFAGWYRFLYNAFNIEQYIIQGKPNPWYFKLLIGCEKCISGQLALWIFLIQNIQFYKCGMWSLAIPHLLFVGFTILCATVLSKLISKYII